MHIALLVLAIATLAGCLAAGVEVTLGARRLVRLEDVPPVGQLVAPLISVVIPACNEERSIAGALRSVLAQDYPRFEVIAIDDRSTDSTGAILDSLAAADSRLRVIHISDLPAGWLGKNHALQRGGESATGSLILFTDADVVMDASVLRRAAARMESNRLDHLAIAPLVEVGGFLSNAFLAVFAILFVLHTKPWKVGDPKSSHYIGIGAFNMVRATAWREAGGHRPIAMRPDDDVRLGKLMKMGGFRQDFVVGSKLLVVVWYHSFAEMRNGLMKNLFAGADYRVPVIVAGCVFQIVFLVWPFVAVAITGGVVRGVNIAIVSVLLALFAANAGLPGIGRRWSLTLPIGALTGVYLMVRATARTLIRGGIDWRGTHYRLDELRGQSNAATAAFPNGGDVR